MRLIPMWLVAVGVVATPVSMAVAAETRLAPKTGSKWAVDFGEEKCRLMRYFGDGDQPNLLIFDKFYPGKGASLPLAGPDIRPFAGGKEIGLRFGPSTGEPEKIKPPAASFNDYGQAIFISSIAIGPPPALEPESSEPEGQSPYDVEGLPQFDEEALKSIEWLEISRRSNRLLLELPQMPQALEVLDRCAQDFVTYWGLDLESHKTMTRMAEPINLQEIAREIQRSYPSRALNAGEQTTMNLRIIVDADGSIEECAISDVTKSRYIDSPACDVFGDRAMFAPAEDAQGDPMKSYYTVTIRYVIP